MFKKNAGFRKLGLIVGLVVCIVGIPVLTASGADKTPIEIYNPEFEFPTERITLRFWEVYPERQGWYEWAKKIADEYSQIHPNVTIEIREIPVPGIHTMFLSAIEAGTMPEVFTLYTGEINAWGVASPAPDWVERMLEEEFTEAARDAGKYTGPREDWYGKYIGWPSVEIDCGQMLYYNKSHFEEVGLDPENPPKTAPALIDATKKLTKYGPGENIVRGGWGIRYFGEMSATAGKWNCFLGWWRDLQKGDVFKEDSWTDLAPWTSPPYMKAAKLYHDMVWKWKVASVVFPAPVEAFKLGLASMTNREAFMIGVLKRDAPNLNYGIAPLVNGAPPYGDKVVGQGPPGHLSCVFHGAKYPQVAWDFNMFLMTDEHARELTEFTGSIPRKKANLDLMEKIFWSDVYKETVSRPMTRQEGTYDPWGVYPELHVMLGETIAKIATHEDVDVEAELRLIEEKAKKVLKEAIEAKKGA